jgi:plasmid maintenance system antidote protein VapI
LSAGSGDPAFKSSEVAVAVRMLVDEVDNHPKIGTTHNRMEFARRIHVAQSYLSALERGEKEPGAAVLLAISREFGKSVDWLLTGKAHVEPKKRVARDSPGT